MNLENIFFFQAEDGIRDRRACNHRGGIQYALDTEPRVAARVWIGDGGCAHHSISRQGFYGSLDSVQAVLITRPAARRYAAWREAGGALFVTPDCRRTPGEAAS